MTDQAMYARRFRDGKPGPWHEITSRALMLSRCGVKVSAWHMQTRQDQPEPMCSACAMYAASGRQRPWRQR